MLKDQATTVREIPVALLFRQDRTNQRTESLHLVKRDMRVQVVLVQKYPVMSVHMQQLMVPFRALTVLRAHLQDQRHRRSVLFATIININLLPKLLRAKLSSQDTTDLDPPHKSYVQQAKQGKVAVQNAKTAMKDGIVVTMMLHQLAWSVQLGQRPPKAVLGAARAHSANFTIKTRNNVLIVQLAPTKILVDRRHAKIVLLTRTRHRLAKHPKQTARCATRSVRLDRWSETLARQLVSANELTFTRTKTTNAFRVRQAPTAPLKMDSHWLS